MGVSEPRLINWHSDLAAVNSGLLAIGCNKSRLGDRCCTDTGTVNWITVRKGELYTSKWSSVGGTLIVTF